MPPPGQIRVGNFEGATKEEVEQEPAWSTGGNHRVGFLNNQSRLAGITRDGDHEEEEEADHTFTKEAIAKYNTLKQAAHDGKLLNFQDVMKGQSDFHKQAPENFPPGWRFMVLAREDWIKSEQEWPANIKRREKEEADHKKKDAEERKREEEEDQKRDPDDEENWRRGRGDPSEKHNAAYGKGGDETGKDQDRDNRQQSGHAQSNDDATTNGDGEHKSEYQKLREKYSPEEIVLLRHLQSELHKAEGLEQNDGKHESPVKKAAMETSIEIDTADQFTPDNWIPRCKTLTRLTGPHPLNGEPDMTKLFDAGLITPNAFHYVRNHGAVPRLFWETHRLNVNDGTLNLSMDELVNNFDPINIPVALACDGNRRGELNMIKKSKGFTWGAAAVSCAYWKGALLCDVLAAAGVPRISPPGKRMWVNFEGADDPSEGKYATCIPLDYAMDPGNDVLLAYEMSNVRLPPDHGYPVRLMIPGYIGGRCVRWLARIWTSEHENQSHYHIWDNRVLPSFITEKDGEFARTMFHHPSTACNEQNLNSAIVRPSQGEKTSIIELLKQDTYRVEGYAYDGGGHEVQRVELSLDEGKTWLYCARNFPDRPVRHGKKFWTWLHWHIDVDTGHMIEAKSLIVRCFNVFKNTQPEHGAWNTMGMMNNGWYTVKPTLEHGGNLLWRHPVDTENNEGWMKPSVENQLQAAKQSSGTPEKQFTRQEVEKHTSQDDAWLVIDDKVYDVTSVLSWHPGGKASILAYAGKLTSKVTGAFESIHDEYAHKKLAECVIGRVTDKASNFMKQQAKAEAEKAAKGGDSVSKVLLQAKSWTPVTLKGKKKLSADTFAYTFQVPKGKRLGLGTCQHIQFGIHMQDKILVRSYTPTRPIMEFEEDGTVELTVKTYFPNDDQPGGAFSNFLYALSIGEQVDVNGPTGEIEYLGNSKFNIEGNERTLKKVSLTLGGSGITPGYQLVVKVLESKDDKTELRVLDANKSQDDILLRERLDDLAEKHKDQIKITHVLSHPKKGWDGLKGHVDAEIVKDSCFAPSENSVVFLCGPPAMIQKAALPALMEWGYEEEKNCFGF